ncbi:MAG TPA: hypothetical protein VGS20_10755 [Candidatus Acidoferrales bacterium]|nr:hypothetical protein [Candidatus Acidoferrales bacterium]
MTNLRDRAVTVEDGPATDIRLRHDHGSQYLSDDPAWRDGNRFPGHGIFTGLRAPAGMPR